MTTHVTRRRRAEGLLDEIADSALDDDYYLVRSGDPRDGRTTNTVTVGAVMAVFATLVTLAALQGSAERPERIQERSAMITDIAVGRAEVATLQGVLARLDREVRSLGDADGLDGRRTGEVPSLGGSVPVRGPGLVVELSDAEVTVGDAPRVGARDLRVVLNGLWYAGAEAIAVDGLRITSLSAVTSADGVVQVNYVPLSSPITVSAIGDTSVLEQRFRAGAAGRYLEGRTEDDGLAIDVRAAEDLALDGDDRVASLEFAEALEEAR